MSNKIPLILVFGVIILVGVFVLSKNQTTVTPGTQVQDTTQVVDQNDAIENQDERVEGENEDVEQEGNEAEEEETFVSVTDTGFEPQTVTVKAGTKVVWKNNAAATTNVSSAQHPTHLVYPPLNLGNFEPGESVSLIFSDPGSYNYHNHLNPSKVGTVVVE